MPHSARKKSESGYYHVVPKGIADQIIFEDDEDRALYVELLRKAKAETGIRLHAYCLMSNHTHLVIEDEHDRLAEAMKYLHERYAMHYAEKIGRTGGIFRKPYWSEPIDTDGYLLCAVRYTHANPAAAGICPASVYEWSSARDYLGRAGGIADTSMVLEMLGGKDGFIEFSKMSNATAFPFPGSRLKAHLSDDEAVRIAREVLGRDNINLAKASPEERGAALQLLAERGFTTRQVSRICGLGKSTVARFS